MADKENSFDAPKEENINLGQTEIEDDDEEEEESFSELRSTVGPVGPDFVESQSEIGDLSSSNLFPVTDGDVNLLGFGGFKDQVGAFQQVLLASELSPTSVTQSTLSTPRPTKFEPKRSAIVMSNDGSVSQKSNQKFSVQKSSADGYKWRKYGQKQVKSTKGSRSYYRCTFSDCSSKKIKCSDQSGNVVETIYKGPHNHEPPRKVNSTKESKLAGSSVSDVAKSSIVSQVKSLIVPDQSSSSRGPIQETPQLLDESIEVYIKDEQIVGPEPKERLKKRESASPGPSVKLGKKPKLVVHADGGVGILSDGYRWRKYGQKMVKGNRHPRNYYRCTSAGCPVRKHIETAVENTTALIITYKGVHDHDTPIPKKRQAPPSALLVAAAAPSSMSNAQQLKTYDTALPSKQPPSSSQWSLDTEGVLIGETLNQGGDKTMDSTRTLLSVGIEIKPC